MQMLDKEFFLLSFVIFVMFFKMQGCGIYEKEGLKGGLALNIFSRHLESKKSPWNLCPFQSYKNSLIYNASLIQDIDKNQTETVTVK